MLIKRKEYEKPAMQVVELKQQQLLAGSTTGQMNDPEDYLLEDDPFAI